SISPGPSSPVCSPPPRIPAGRCLPPRTGPPTRARPRQGHPPEASDPLLRRTMTARRPNILLILSDDHASHAISAYGSVVKHTPHIDRKSTRLNSSHVSISYA